MGSREKNDNGQMEPSIWKEGSGECSIRLTASPDGDGMTIDIRDRTRGVRASISLAEAIMMYKKMEEFLKENIEEGYKADEVIILYESQLENVWTAIEDILTGFGNDQLTEGVKWLSEDKSRANKASAHIISAVTFSKK